MSAIVSFWHKGSDKRPFPENPPRTVTFTSRDLVHDTIYVVDNNNTSNITIIIVIIKRNTKIIMLK